MVRVGTRGWKILASVIAGRGAGGPLHSEDAALYRGLYRSGLLGYAEGRYNVTVAGLAAMHEQLVSLYPEHVDAALDEVTEHFGNQ